jgi:hypothetical protein
MNPLDCTIVRLGAYIAQLEAQNTELHRQLVEKTKEFDQYQSDVKGDGLGDDFQSQMLRAERHAKQKAAK